MCRESQQLIQDLSKGIKDTLTYLKNLEADIAVIKTVNDRTAAVKNSS